LAWSEVAAGFEGECLLIPAADIPKIAIDDGSFLRINFHPSSPERTLLDPYRQRLGELDRLVLDACGPNPRMTSPGVGSATTSSSAGT
jgi:hypothetical protein